MTEALDNLYRGVTGHRVFTTALLLLGGIFLWDMLTRPIFGLVVLSGVFADYDIAVESWWADAHLGLIFIGLASVWLILASYLVRSVKAFREENVAGNAGAVPLFVLKRLGALLFLAYFSECTLGYFFVTLRLQTLPDAGWFPLKALAAAVIFFAVIALLALLAQRGRHNLKVE